MSKPIVSEQNIKDKIEMYQCDIFNIKLCIERNRKENKRLKVQLGYTKARIEALELMLTH